MSVSLGESIQDIKQVVSSLPQSGQYTNFSLAYDSFKIDDSLALIDLIGAHELEDVEELTLHLHEDPYTESSVREHVLKVRDILGLNSNVVSQPESYFNGSSKFQNLSLNPVKASPAEPASEDEKKQDEFTTEEKEKALEVTEKIFVPATLPEHSITSSFSLTPAIRSLALSVWNPPSPTQALRGDLMYLQAQTLEGENYQITANVAGFFVNKSSSSNFDGSLNVVKKASEVSITHSLLDLLSRLSPKLITQLELNGKVLSETEPEVFLNPGNAFMSTPWIVGKPPKRSPDAAQSQLNYLVGGADGADLSKDWNEEFQSIRELPKEEFSQKVMRERLLNRIGYEFTTAASKTAISIIRGELQPINPEENSSLHVFLRSGIFYSFGTDVSDIFQQTGGDEAARAAASRDLKSISALNRFDLPDVYHVLTAIVDYCGKRVVCQAPVPGIFNRDESSEDSTEKVVYGLTDSGNKLLVDEKFKTKFTAIGEAFHLKPHNGWTHDGSSSQEVVTSVESKGLKGTDGRDYIIELYRTTPLDIEFIEKHWTPGVKDSYPHREVTLRHEAVDEWWRRQVAVLLKKESDKLDAEDRPEGEEKPTITIAPNEVSLNPDAFSLSTEGVSESDIKELEKDEERVRDVSKFITEQLIPDFISDVTGSNLMVPIDGAHLVSMIHKRGINVRYLGHLATEVLKAEKEALEAEQLERDEIKKANETYKPSETTEDDESKDKKDTKANLVPRVANLQGLYAIIVQEIIARAVKHVLRDYTSILPLPLVTSCITHFHNCLLGSDVNDKPEAEIDQVLKIAYKDCDFSFTKLTPSIVNEMVAEEAFIRFRYQLPENWNTSLVKKLPLMREIAQKFGIQWTSKSYAFTKEDYDKSVKPVTSTPAPVASKLKKKGKKSSPEPSSQETLPVQALTFRYDDIVSLYPIVKDSIYKSAVVNEIWDAGNARIQSEEDRELGLNLLTECVQFYEQIYGNIHPQVGRVYGLMAQVYHDLGMTDKACEVARKAAIVLERTLGFDSYETILAMVNSAFFEQENKSALDSLAIYSQVLSEWSIVFGENHPSVVTTLTNIASLLQAKKLVKEAAKVTSRAADLSSKIHGELSPITGMVRYQLAQFYIMSNEMELAAVEMKKSYELFEVSVGKDDTFTEEISKWISALETLKTRREEASQKQQQDLKKLEHGKKVKRNGKLLADDLKQSKLKKSSKQQASIPEIANQSVEEILAFIEGSTPSKKKSKVTKK